MASRPELQPRAPWTIRNLVAAQGLAHVLPTLPVGYWQRRVAARAFALDLMPAIPRESQHVRLVRLSGMPPLWLLASTVMTWGVVPWMWRADARTERAEARAAVARVGRHAHAHVRRGLRGRRRASGLACGTCRTCAPRAAPQPSAPWGSSRWTKSATSSRRPRPISRTHGARERIADTLGNCARWTRGGARELGLPFSMARSRTACCPKDGQVEGACAPWLVTGRAQHWHPGRPLGVVRVGIAHFDRNGGMAPVAIHRTVEGQRDASPLHAEQAGMAVVGRVERHREAEPVDVEARATARSSVGRIGTALSMVPPCTDARLCKGVLVRRRRTPLDHRPAKKNLSPGPARPWFGGLPRLVVKRDAAKAAGR